ncbi:helix-turn-helix domain-containing protein [Rufibacter ruber]|uniref:helix-turn-helix domain-containing protein n=1 Tax=Rufibacter ruber TaxID=1783499 RepID=UPI00082B456F|nr:helix-turn-helix domain-containing protein [Rufibacter ruber]
MIQMNNPTLSDLLNIALGGIVKQSLLEVLGDTGLLAPTSNAEERYFDVSQAAKFLKIPKSTLYSYTSGRLIPHYKRGKRLVFKQSDLEQWLTDSKKKTISEIEAEVYSSRSKKGGKK